MSEHHVYTTHVEWTKQRKGALSSAFLPTIEVATPPNFPGGHEGIWSPEHLYTASAEICLMTTFLSLAERAGLGFKSYKSDAEGTLEKVEKGLQMTRIHIRPTVVVDDEPTKEQTIGLLQKAEKYCLISNSMKTVVSIEPNVLVG
ncbi:MAG: OsmC family protein [Sphaerochaeta sp.]|jgi:organic hydroperoxide reductase OsmC/OhrA|uniref:OsmC family protein n=1 Tax=Sphaerochaeta sp. TaxID=1972642 RepID=UPI002FC99B98